MQVMKHIPRHVRAGIKEDSLKIPRKLGSFFLAVLDHIIGKIQESQFSAGFC